MSTGIFIIFYHSQKKNFLKEVINMNNKTIAYINTLYSIIDSTISDLIESEMSQYAEDINYDRIDTLVNLLDATDNYIHKIKASM